MSVSGVTNVHQAGGWGYYGPFGGGVGGALMSLFNTPTSSNVNLGPSTIGGETRLLGDVGVGD